MYLLAARCGGEEDMIHHGSLVFDLAAESGWTELHLPRGKNDRFDKILRAVGII
jgi:hypothetical protein